MRQLHQVAAILAIALMITGCTGDRPETPAAESYFGQTAPGLKPVLFAPGLISTPDHNERDLALSSDGSEIYFTRDATIMVSTRVGDNWSEPEPASFSYDCPEFEPFLTRDDRRMYFISQRPLSGTGDPEDYQLWMVDRDESGWGVPERVTDLVDFYPSLAHDSIMYFTDHANDLYRTRLVDGLMTVREKLSDSINTPAAEYNSYVAPDESFLLFTSHGWSDWPGGGDLYVSYRKDDGSWTRARHMGSGINTGAIDYCPSLSPDGKHLFFASRRRGGEDIYWVDASIIDTLRSSNLDFSGQLFAEAAGSGFDAFRQRLTQMRDEHSAYCDFGPDVLNAVGDRLLAGGLDARASEIFAFVREIHPDDFTPAQNLKLALLQADEADWHKTVTALTISDDRDPGLESSVNLMGYGFLQLERPADAMRLFELNVDLFPASANVYDSYGEALLARGDTAAAITNYRRSLELDSTNTNAVRVLEGLGAM